MFDIDLDSGFRAGAFDVAATYYATPYIGAELQFVDEGRQPSNIPNVNRPVNMDVKFNYPVDDFSFTIKAGVTSSYFSYNGSGNGYHNDTGFTGGNIGGGVSYKIRDHWSLNAQVVSMKYDQSDIPEYETFTYGSIGLKYSFGGL